MPKINALPNGNNQLPAIQAKTVKINSQATPQNSAEKILSQRPEEPKDKGQATNTEANGAEASTPIDPKFEALAKKEAAFVAKERDLKAKEAAFETKIQEAVKLALDEYRTKVKTNPLDALNELEVTYDQLVEQAVNAPDPSTRRIESELKSLRNAQAKLIEDQKKSADSQRQAAVTQIKHDVSDLVNSDANFETIKATESVDDVVELITRTFDETGKLMSVEDAAKAVEEELFAEAMKIASIGKVKAKLTPETIQESKQQNNQKQQIQTLTNSMSTGRKLTSRERAILAFENKLKG